MSNLQAHIDELALPSTQRHNSCHLFDRVLEQPDAHVWDWAEHKSWAYDTEDQYEVNTY